MAVLFESSQCFSFFSFLYHKSLFCSKILKENPPTWFEEEKSPEKRCQNSLGASRGVRRITAGFILGENAKVLSRIGAITRRGPQRFAGPERPARPGGRDALSRALLPQQIRLPVRGIVQVKFRRVPGALGRRSELLIFPPGKDHTGSGFIVGDREMLAVNVLQGEELTIRRSGEAAGVEGDVRWALAPHIEARFWLETFQ